VQAARPVNSNFQYGVRDHNSVFANCFIFQQKTMIRIAVLFAALISAANGWVFENPQTAFKQVSSVVGCAAIAATIAVAPVEAEGVPKGEQLFQADCAQCHRAITALPGDQAKLQEEAIKKYRGGADEATIKDYVQNQLPHGYMPFARKYSDKDYSDVARYVVQIAK
jgi:mono/diheme cytochrome c family protein